MVLNAQNECEAVLAIYCRCKPKSNQNIKNKLRRRLHPKV